MGVFNSCFIKSVIKVVVIWFMEEVLSFDELRCCTILAAMKVKIFNLFFTCKWWENMLINVIRCCSQSVLSVCGDWAIDFEIEESIGNFGKLEHFCSLGKVMRNAWIHEDYLM